MTAEAGMKQCDVYIMANKIRTVCTCMTTDLNRRVFEHKHKLVKGFTSRYNITELVYFEEHWEPSRAIAREKQINGWRRSKKIDLRESMDPDWKYLAADFETE